MSGSLERLGLADFCPLPGLRSGKSQTYAAAYWPSYPDPDPAAVHTVGLPDGDSLQVVEDRPAPAGDDATRIALLVHGLAGDHHSNYLSRVARRLVGQGTRVWRVNLRGCGIGFGLARRPYHSGRSEDLRAVVLAAERKFPRAKVTVIGFSLGANIALKLAGEDGSHPSGNMDSVVAISAPVDLAATARHLQKSEHLVFDQFFVWKLRYDIWKLHQRFPELPKPRFPLKMALTDIDELYTAPRSGFRDAADYYAQCSSGGLIPLIRIRGLCLCADDDPIIDAEAYRRIEFPQSVERVLTRQGGHVGFLGRVRASEFRGPAKVAGTGTNSDLRGPGVQGAGVRWPDVQWPDIQWPDIQWMDALIGRWVARLDE